ncbi:MAG TPA: hypothetical protein VNF72_01095, partial [Myxococcota bacterium]|nr:hypothetical protein [Myxococcota bacterium]
MNVARSWFNIATRAPFSIDACQQRLAVGLSGGCLRQLAPDVERLRDHVRGQQAQAERLQLVAVERDAVVRRDECAQPRADLRIGHRHDRGFLHLLVRVQHLLDLAELDPVAARLHHVIAPADEEVVAIGRAAHDVAGAVDAVFEGRLEGIFHEHLRRLLRQAPVAGHDGAAAHPQLALGALVRHAAVLAEREHLGVGARRADRDGRRRGIEIARHVVVGADVRLRRAIQVVELDARQDPHHLEQVLLRKHLAGEEQHAEMRIPDLVHAAVQEHAHQRRGNRVPDRDALLVDPLRLLARERRDLIGHQHHARAAAERHVDVEDRQVEVQRRVAREAVLRAHVEGLRAPVDERERVAMRDDHALRAAGGAGGVE